MKNWLVTWESWDDKKIKDKDRISAILDDSLPLEDVLKIVKLLYINHECTISERLQYANGRFDPFSAQVDYSKETIVYGHDPHLFARRVKNCRVEGDGWEEKLHWDKI
ncbi:MAG: hypothetical protein STSR0001_09650 [Methanothrix sp.]